jgi:chaperonin GroEL
MVPQRSSAKMALPRPGLVFQPRAYDGMRKGINLIAEAVRPTLGPLPRRVAIDPVSRGNTPPELFDNGALIARRIIELPDRDADMGAMLLRQMLWKQDQEVGDGTVTAAVLFQSVYNEGLRYIAAGANPMRLRHFLENGLRVILHQLTRNAVPLDGQDCITQLAMSICHDAPLAATLGEIFDTLREHGSVEFRSGRRRDIEWEFVEGTYYRGGIHSLVLFAGGQRHIELTDAAVFVSDLDLEEPEQLVRLIALAYAARKKALVIVARNISERLIGVLVSVNKDPRPFQAIAVKAPDDLQEQAAMLDDLGILSGGRVFRQATGDTVDGAQLDDLGGARRVWANSEYFGVVGGKGSARTLRQHVSALRRAFDRTDDLEMRKKLRERIGKLMGGAAILHVGDSTDLELKARRDNAERTAAALRSALVRGCLPGGGAALLSCRPVLRRMAECAEDPDERMAYRILIRGLEEPTRAIIENAGYEAEPILRQIEKSGTGFDVRCGEIVDMAGVGIIDSAGMVMTAVQEAIAGAALALTIQVLVHHRKPATSVDP